MFEHVRVADKTKFATVQIMRYNEGHKLLFDTKVWVSEAEWKSINYVDYIELDYNGSLCPEFVDAHKPEVQRAMLVIAGRA